MKKSFGIHWFRRDLRVSGNLALKENCKKNEGRVIGLFCFDSRFLSRPDFSIERFHFFLRTLSDLRDQLLEYGSDLLVLDALPLEAFERLSKATLQDARHCKHIWTTLSYNRDYEPFARERDAEIEKWVSRNTKIEIISERDHLVFEPRELLKESNGGFYQVYTPFFKKWLTLLKSDLGRERIAYQRKALAQWEKKLSIGHGASDEKSQKPFHLNWKELFESTPVGFPASSETELLKMRKAVEGKASVPLMSHGFSSAYEEAKTFGKKIKEYKQKRDFPGVSGGSRMSRFLKNGSFTTSQLIALFDLEEVDEKKELGKLVYLKELAWREFYYHILYHVPRVENEAFQEKYKDLPWENREDWFEKWKRGETGFPIVDAGMRELLATGWMHNRVRMIVASFLTKDLLIDWRWGERWFMEKLVDGDLAPNNGGWQWSASTGCDAQPYFRIFNPVSQSRRFDPEGDYIKKWVPELRSVSAEQIHAPWESSLLTSTYSTPLVDHALQRDRALSLFKTGKRTSY